MKKSICLAAVCLGFLLGMAIPAYCQSQVVEGYTFIRGPAGPLVCLGQWVPSGDPALPGTCQGQLVDVTQLTAVSAGQSADRLSDILDSLDSIDQKIAVSNDRLERLIDATVSTQNAIDEQSRSVSEVLRETIIRRFDELPAKMMESKEFREEMTKLKEEILSDVKKLYPAKSSRQAK